MCVYADFFKCIYAQKYIYILHIYIYVEVFHTALKKVDLQMWSALFHLLYPARFLGFSKQNQDIFGNNKETVFGGGTCFCPCQAFYAGSCKSIEEKLRKAYQKSTGADATTEGSATMTHGIVVDKCTNKFMATYKVSKEHGSISKIFDTRQDAEFWFDSLNALMKQGRLAGNLSALRQAAATRKATAAAINKIMEENISLEPESRDAYKREVKEGKDVFDKIFKKSSGSGLRRASVHLFKASSDQLQECAGKGVVNGVLCGSWHASLGWRPTTIIVFGSGFDKDSADAFVAKSGLTKLGVISCSDSPKPSEGDFAKFAQVAKTSECKNCVMWHLVQERFQVSSRFFQHNPDTKVPEEVSMEFISRRLNGEDVRILGLDEKESAASRSRAAANCQQMRKDFFAFFSPTHTQTHAQTHTHI